MILWIIFYPKSLATIDPFIKFEMIADYDLSQASPNGGLRAASGL